jgi:hypothetical protein
VSGKKSCILLCGDDGHQHHRIAHADDGAVGLLRHTPVSILNDWPLIVY